MALLIALGFEFVDGFHDTANAVATAVYTHPLAGAEFRGRVVKTAQGASVAVYRSGTFVTVDDAVITGADLPASNGTVQIVDKVLTPR